MRDYLDQDPDVPPTSTANLGPYARFLADLPDWSDLSQSDYTKAFESGAGGTCFRPVRFLECSLVLQIRCKTKEQPKTNN